MSCIAGVYGRAGSHLLLSLFPALLWLKNLALEPHGVRHLGRVCGPLDVERAILEIWCELDAGRDRLQRADEAGLCHVDGFFQAYLDDGACASEAQDTRVSAGMAQELAVGPRGFHAGNG